MPIISDATNMTLRIGLDRRASRQNLLASNLANIDTPEYVAKDLEFEGALREAAEASDADGLALARTEDGHMGGPGSSFTIQNDEVVERADTIDTLDGNGVDLDKELVRYTDNAIKYTGGAEMLRRRYGILQAVLSEYRAT